MDDSNQMLNIDPMTLMSQSTQEECKECGCILFKQVVAFRRISKILLQSPKDQLVPIPVFICNDCNAPISDMLPKENKNDNDKDGKIIKLNE